MVNTSEMEEDTIVIFVQQHSFGFPTIPVDRMGAILLYVISLGHCILWFLSPYSLTFIHLKRSVCSTQSSTEE